MFSCGHWIVSAKGAHEPKVQTVGAYPSFLSMHGARLHCYSPLGRNARPLQGYPQQCVTVTHLYTWVKGDKVE